MSIAKKVILDELIENSHFEKVENVIYWALEHYAESKKTKGSLIAYSIKERIFEAERSGDAELQNPELIEELI